MSRGCEVVAPAKINLYLAIGDKRPDGYHDVCTVLHTLELVDMVCVSEASSESFECFPSMGLVPADNLAFCARQAMAQAFGYHHNLSIRVVKRIPSGAGLGGASSDAAAVVSGLARLWGIELQSPELYAVARSLGADVPFFLAGGAAHYGERGDVLERALPSIDMPVALVKPAEPVLTRDAYAAFDMLRNSQPDTSPLPNALIAALEEGNVRSVAANLYNSMIESSVAIVPAIADALSLLAQCKGVLGYSMAGSGSACYALCETDEDAKACAERASRLGFWALATRTRAHGCEVC